MLRRQFRESLGPQKGERSALVVLRTRVLIPEPDPKKIAIIRKEALRPFVAGSGDLSYVCDACEFTLVDRVETMDLRDWVFECPKCGVFSEVI